MRPCGIMLGKRQFIDEYLQASNEVLELLLRKMIRFLCCSRSLPRVFRIQVYVQVGKDGELCFFRHHRCNNVDWNSIWPCKHQPRHLPLAVVHNHQRAEKTFAELPIRNPWLLFIFFKGKSVDEAELSLVPLDVEWCGIFQNHSLPQCNLHDAKREKGRIFQHTKTPFIRVSDEGNSLRLYGDASCRKFVLYLHAFMLQQKPLASELIVQPARM